MALTHDAEQRLSDAGLLEFFDQHTDMWISVARRAYNFAKGDFPDNAIIRHDDVAKILLPVVEVHEGLRSYLSENKLRGKFWKEFFVDFITDRTWPLISGSNQ